MDRDRIDDKDEKTGMTYEKWVADNGGMEPLAANPDRVDADMTLWPEREANDNPALRNQIDHVLAQLTNLTDKQREVLTLLSHGYSERDVSDILKISQPVVHKHVIAARKKIKPLE